MENNVSNIVNKVISEEINKRIDSVRNKIFENKNMKKSMCSECGSNKMYEGECIECGYMMEGEIQELGGMEDGHPKLGKERLPKRMSPEEIEKLLRGDDKTSSEDDDYPTKPGFIKKRMSQHSNRKHNDGEVREGRYVTSKGGRFDREEIPMSRQDMEMDMTGFDKEEFCSHYYNADLPECVSYYNNKVTGELGERLHGNQKRIDKNKNNRIDAEDFKMLRKESVYEVTLDNNERFRFNESEIVDVIENIILEEKKKSKSKTKPTSKSEPKAKNPIKLTKSNQDKSKKENDDYIESVVKKMKDYLKDGSKGNYEMNPKHFPKGNGELGEMGKKAYKASTAVEEYVENFTAAALENLDYDDIKANEEWVEDNVVGSTRTGNNPEWANAVETDVNKKRNKIRKDNLLAKMKKKAYNKAPQPVNDEAGENTDKASKIMMQLESENERKVMSDMEKIKNLMDYGKKTQ
jgi:hypothetical protein